MPTVENTLLIKFTSVLYRLVKISYLAMSLLTPTIFTPVKVTEEKSSKVTLFVKVMADEKPERTRFTWLRLALQYFNVKTFR